MSDLVKRDTDSWSEVLPAVGDLAGKIAATEFVPDAMRGKPAVVAAAMLYGRELGLGPMTALRSINVIKGKPALSAEAMRAMILAAGHHLSFREMTAARCIVDGRRKGEQETTSVTYTMDDAKKAGLAGQSQYAKMPRQMLAARATSELARLIFADVIGGLLIDIEAEEGEAPEAANVTPITTARRARAPKADAVPAEVVESTPEPEPDPEPVLDDDILDAEIVEDEPAGALPPEHQDMVDVVTASMDAEVVSHGPTPVSGPELLRQELAKSRDKRPPAGPISPSQLKALQAGFKDCGVDGREERLAIASRIAGRDLSSANDLDSLEAKNVLDALAHAKGTNDPAETLRIGF